MKHIKKLATGMAASILGILLVSTFVSCTGRSDPSDTIGSTAESEQGGENVTRPSITPISFDHIKPAEDIEKFIAEVDYANGEHDNSQKEIGTVVSPYFTMKAGGVPVDCYAVRTTYGAHSYALIDVADEAFPLEITVQVETDFRRATILPEHYGVTPTVDGKTVTATIDKCGNYTLVLNKDKTKALTIFVRSDKEYVAPEGYEVIKIAPGVHNEKITFTKEKQVLYFEAGEHELMYNINFLSNTEVYVERGAYIYATIPEDLGVEPPTSDPNWAGNRCWDTLFHGDRVENVRISGHGMVDMSRLSWHARGLIQFNESKNITVDGLASNNCPDWAVYFSRCEEITVSEMMLFAYRQNSDGICIEDSRNALVKDCFARSGDDLFEIKSRYGHCTIPIENIVFDNCNGWPDKARGIGIINEAKRDMDNITFKNCSIGFASATWMEDLGALVVFSEYDGKLSNITFENIEVFKADKYAVLVTVGEQAKAQFDNIVFRNVVFKDSSKVRINNRSTVGGAIHNVIFENCYRRNTKIEKIYQLIPSISGENESVITIVN